MTFFNEDTAKIFLLFSILFFTGFVLIGVTLNNDIEELGQAICEEEYGMDFESYDINWNHELVCKSVEKDYDGLKVRLE